MDERHTLEPILDASEWKGRSPVRQITGRSHYGPLREFSEAVARRARPVAYILRDDGVGGTGFLVSPDLLLTNWHVLPTPELANRCTVWFNFVQGDSYNPIGAMPYTCGASGADGFFCASPYEPKGVDIDHLDYALVRVNIPHPPGETWGFVPITESPYTAFNMALTIIQHPQHNPMYVGQGDGQLKHRSELLLQYVTDTEYGSSGAPVFNRFWELVGLHHARFDFSMGANLDDGSIIRGSGKANEGIAITAILKDLHKRAPQVALPPEQRDAEGNLLWA